jgi:hypothetical protein
MVGSHKQVFQEILIPDGTSPGSTPTPVLYTVFTKRCPLDISQVRNGYHDILVRDGIFNPEIAG